MSEFSTRIEIDAPAEDVFAFVIDFDNMPEYLPVTKKASPAGEGQIRMQGEMNGRTFDTVGWFQVHEFNKTMLWGAKGDNDYSGDLEVMDQGQSCVLSINVKVGSLPDASDEDRKKLESRKSEIQKSLDEVGRKIKRLCESAAVPRKEPSRGYAI